MKQKPSGTRIEQKSTKGLTVDGAVERLAAIPTKKNTEPQCHVGRLPKGPTLHGTNRRRDTDYPSIPRLAKLHSSLDAGFVAAP